MNKYQEAFESMFPPEKMTPIFQQFISLIQMMEIKRKDYEVIKELVEKATPKKLIDMSKEPHDTIGVCSNCKTWCYMEYHSEYCGECGQALDWSEEDD